MPGTTIDLHEKVFEYDVDERAAWCGTDTAKREEILAVTGDLGRSRGTYSKQAKDGQNYPEVRYAMHLIVDAGFPRGSVIYENFLVSATAMKATGERSLYKRPNTLATLHKVFAPAFFSEMDRIFDLNPAVVPSQDRTKLHVDLCAVDFATRRCRFVELKRIGPKRSGHEKIGKFQILYLAAIRSAVASLGSGAFLEEPYTVETELVVFVPRDVIYKPVTHPVDFSV